MEFWGAEVKSGLPLEVTPGENCLVHLSQASLGELKKEKGCESVTLFVTVDGKKLVLGRLSVDKFPQQQFDLVFDRTFKLSHNLKSGSIHFFGYKANNQLEEYPLKNIFCNYNETDSDGEIPFLTKEVEPNAKQEKSPAEAVEADTSKGKESDAGKQKVKIVEPIRDVNPEEVDESSSDDGMMSEDDEDDSQDEDDTDDSDGSASDESDDETPKKNVNAESSKKRPAESASKTPVQVKKAKVTPQKTDGKKAVSHVATPHPAKQAGKTPGNKPNQQTPKSTGSVTCNSCNRTFKSEQALDSHAKAKHSSGK
ncbi:hypothetical protein OROMI_012225 [Orobanche minor]